MQKLSQYIFQKFERVRPYLPPIFKKTQQLQFKLLAPEGSKSAKIGSVVQLPRNRYLDLEAYLQKFYNSASQNGRCNGQNLVFVTGAEGAGKSGLIRDSLKDFKNRKNKHAYRKDNQEIPFTTLSSPQYLQDLEKQTKLDNQFSLILQIDFSVPNPRHFKPQAFFHYIHTEIIGQLLNLQKQIQRKINISILDLEIVRDVVVAENSMEFLWVFVRDVVYGMGEGGEGLLTGIGKEIGKKLEEINERVIEMRCEEFFGYSSAEGNQKKYMLKQIVDLIAQENKISNLQATLKFFLAVFKKIEHENRPAVHTTRLYQSGIQTTQYLFSILNYLCGFGALNKSTLQSHLNNAPNPYQKSYIGKGNHIDTILTLSHLPKLSCYRHPKFVQWFDHLLISLQNGSNLRTHFPVVIEIADSWELEQLQRCGRMEVDNPTVVEIPGYYSTHMFRYSPAMVMNQKSIDRLRPVLGRNPSTWNQAIIQLSKGTTLQQLIQYKSPFMQALSHSFTNKINKLYLSPQSLPYIDNNTLYLHIMQFMHILDKCGGYLKTYYIQHNTLLFANPIFTQLITNNLVYQSYYNLSLDLVDHRYLYPIRQCLYSRSFLQKLQYKIWSRFLSPYTYYMKELRYREVLEKEMKNDLGIMNERADYMVREYYGGLQGYRVEMYEQVYKEKYNL